MSLNDTNLGVPLGVNVHPGVANPTSSSNDTNPMHTNFVSDPTIDEFGAGAGKDFEGHRQANRTFKETAGVIEARPGIIESTNIDPLNEHSNDDDGWANVKPIGSSGSNVTGGAANMAKSAATMAGGAARLAYGTVVGDESAKKAGKEAVFGSK